MKKLEFYVLNYNFNQKKVEMWNIFNNWKLSKSVEKEVKRYLENEKNYQVDSVDEERSKLKGFEALKLEIDNLIRWQEWSRAEYEIMVGELFEKDPGKFEKWDCYSQAHANIELITNMCINFYKENK